MRLRVKPVSIFMMGAANYLSFCRFHNCVMKPNRWLND